MIKQTLKVPKAIVFMLLACFVISLSSCDKYRVYETNIDFQDNTWFADSVKTFAFYIQDTVAQYNILYNVRNSVDYGFYNLYVKYELYGTDAKLISSDLHEVQLMNAKTGQPFGSGLGDIFDNRFYALKHLKFGKAGVYSIKIKHYMRKDPLTELLSVGIRVEKAKNEQ